MSIDNRSVLGKVKEIATEIGRLGRRVSALERAPQMRHTSWTGQQAVYDDEGNIRQVVGQQIDGTYTITEVNAPPPPSPSLPYVTALPGILAITWDGTFEGNADRPLDLAYIEVHVSPIPAYVKDNNTQIDVLSGVRGGTVNYAIPSSAGPQYISFVAVNNSRVESIPTAEVGATSTSIELTDGAAPSASPAATVSSLGYGGVMIRWNSQANNDAVRYRVFFDTVNPPVQQLTETSGLLVATSVLPNGTQLQPGTTYYAQIEAFDSDGTAPARGTVGSGGPVVVPASAVAEDVMVVNELFSRTGYFGTVSADKVESGELVAALAILGGLSVGPGITITPDNGIMVAGSDGVTQIPTDGSSISLAADVVARSLTVLGNFTMRGTTNEFGKGSVVTWQSGTTSPKQGPQVTSVYPTHFIHGGYSPRGFAYSHTQDDGNSIYVHTESVAGSVTLTRTVLNPSTGDYDYAFQSYALDTDGGRPEVTTGLGGVTVIDNDHYVLCQIGTFIPGTTKPQWYIYKFIRNAAWTPSDPIAQAYTYATRWLYQPSTALGGNSAYEPAIGTDGDSVYVIQCANGTWTWYVTRYSMAGAQTGFLTFKQADGVTTFNTNRHAGGLVIGAHDTGVIRYWLTHYNYPYIYVFNTAGVRVLAEEFTTPTTGARGLLWDGTRYKYRTDSTVYDFSQIKDADLATNPVNAVQTWRLQDATDLLTPAAGDFAEFETAASPRTQTTSLKKRAWAQLQSPMVIPNAGDPDDADALTFYVARGTGRPANASYRRIVPPTAGVLTQLLDRLPTSGSSPPTVTSFGPGTPAIGQSGDVDASGPLWRLDGAGSARIGPLFTDVTGGGVMRTPHLYVATPERETVADAIFPSGAAVGLRWTTMFEADAQGIITNPNSAVGGDGRIVMSAGGLYLIHVKFQWASSTAGTQRTLSMRNQTGGVIGYDSAVPSAAGGTGLLISTTSRFAADGWFTTEVQQNSGVALGVFGISRGYAHLTVTRIGA